jgi:hypothetical protein
VAAPGSSRSRCAPPGAAAAEHMVSAPPGRMFRT